jgi:hypothetical protein
MLNIKRRSTCLWKRPYLKYQDQVILARVLGAVNENEIASSRRWQSNMNKIHVTSKPKHVVSVSPLQFYVGDVITDSSPILTTRVTSQRNVSGLQNHS